MQFKRNYGEESGEGEGKGITMKISFQVIRSKNFEGERLRSTVLEEVFIQLSGFDKVGTGSHPSLTLRRV